MSHLGKQNVIVLKKIMLSLLELQALKTGGEIPEAAWRYINLSGAFCALQPT